MTTSTVPPGPELPSARRARVAVVTGGTSLVAAEVAERLRQLGLDVVFLDNEAGTAAVGAALAGVAATRGRPGVLVDVVRASAEEQLCAMSDEQWAAATGDPLRAFFVAARPTADLMSESGWGRIVAVAPPPSCGAEHAVLRAGLEGFVRTIALELEPYGVTANLIAPRRPRVGLGAGHLTDASSDDTARYARAVSDAVAGLLGADAVTGQVVYVSTDAAD